MEMKKVSNGPRGPKWARANEGPLGALTAFFELFLALWLKLAIIFFCLSKILSFIFGHIFGFQIFDQLLYNPSPKTNHIYVKFQ